VELFNSVVLGVAIVWVVWILFEMRQRLRTGGIVAPPMFASTLLFALGIIFVLVLSLSSLHLLWWFPVTFLLGIGVLTFPASVHFTMTCLALLAGPKHHHDS
jgi:hypothetical protein